MIFRLTLVVVLLFLYSIPTTVLAQTVGKADLGFEESTPSPLMKVPLGSEAALLKGDHYANVLERFKERITLFFKFSNEDKLVYQQELADKRISELVYIISAGEGDPIEELSSRYGSHIGRLTDFAVNNKLSGKKDGLLKMYDTHLKVLNNIQMNFEFESGWWLLLQHDINIVTTSQNRVKSI